jgi:hypothetical protein
VTVPPAAAPAPYQYQCPLCRSTHSHLYLKMNKSALITVGKKFHGESMFLLSVFDLEPSGVIIHAYNQADSQEYMLPVTEVELAQSGFTRAQESLASLLDTIFLEANGTQWSLQSKNANIKGQKVRPTGDQLEALIRSTENGPSLHDTLVEGLVELCKVKPAGNDAISWLGEWLINNNPSKPRVDE